MLPMVFVPADAALLRSLHAGETEIPLAYAPTGALLTAHGLTAADDEESEQLACILASLQCLAAGRPRLVVAAEVRTLPPELTAAPGTVGPVRLTWGDVRSLFIDDPLDRPTADHITAVLGGDLSALEAYPLLWFAPSEVDAVLAAMEE